MKLRETKSNAFDRPDEPKLRIPSSLEVENSSSKSGGHSSRLEELLIAIGQDCTTQPLTFLEESNTRQNGE